MQMRSICAMCLVSCAMWQSSYAKIKFYNNGFIHGYHALIFCIFLCVQVSLWMLILMIIGHVRNLYTWESTYPSLISFRFLASHLDCLFLFFGESGKRLSSECLHVLHISLHSWVVGYILDPCLAWLSYWISPIFLSKICSLGLLNAWFSYFIFLVHSMDPQYSLSPSIYS
jgi:hypothetical protein